MYFSVLFLLEKHTTYISLLPGYNLHETTSGKKTFSAVPFTCSTLMSSCYPKKSTAQVPD